MAEKKTSQDHDMEEEVISVDTREFSNFNRYQKSADEKGFQYFHKNAQRYYTIYSDGDPTIQYYSTSELMDSVSDRDQGLIKFQIVDQSLVAQWNPNMF